MKHVAALFLALVSLMFFVGANCDSGDFATSYFFCADAKDTTSLTDPTKCPTNYCTTGLQSFTNGQNECNVLQQDVYNGGSNCAILERVALYLNIGCTGNFAENPPMAAPTGLVAGQGGTAKIVLSWQPLVNPIGTVTFNILRGTAPGTEVLLIQNVTGTAFIDGPLDPVSNPSGLTSGVTYYYVISATNVAGTSGLSNEVFASAQ